MKTKNAWVGAGAVLALALGFQGAATAGTVTVQGTSGIWLAGQPDGTSVDGNFGSDTAPANAPVSLDVAANATLTFSAVGSTSVDASCFAGPDGGCYSDQSGFSPTPADGMYNGPASALIGIFTGNSPPSYTSWAAGPDYQMPANTTAGTFAPALNQIFFIGDGWTDTGSGSVQSFSAPVGATHLFLAVADSLGSSTGNAGSLTVDFTGATVSAVPEPANWALMSIGAGLIGFALRRKRSCPQAA